MSAHQQGKNRPGGTAKPGLFPPVLARVPYLPAPAPLQFRTDPPHIPPIPTPHALPTLGREEPANNRPPASATRGSTLPSGSDAVAPKPQITDAFDPPRARESSPPGRFLWVHRTLVAALLVACGTLAWVTWNKQNRARPTRFGSGEKLYSGDAPSLGSPNSRSQAPRTAGLPPPVLPKPIDEPPAARSASRRNVPEPTTTSGQPMEATPPATGPAKDSQPSSLLDAFDPPPAPDRSESLKPDSASPSEAPSLGDPNQEILLEADSGTSSASAMQPKQVGPSPFGAGRPLEVRPGIPPMSESQFESLPLQQLLEARRAVLGRPAKSESQPPADATSTSGTTNLPPGARRLPPYQPALQQVAQEIQPSTAANPPMPLEGQPAGAGSVLVAPPQPVRPPYQPIGVPSLLPPPSSGNASPPSGDLMQPVPGNQTSSLPNTSPTAPASFLPPPPSGPTAPTGLVR
ncbi:MAG: hypothetical protein ACK5PD_17340 [Pirellulaceae bacterium]|jgi:hypothetical protein